MSAAQQEHGAPLPMHEEGAVLWEEDKLVVGGRCTYWLVQERVGGLSG